MLCATLAALALATFDAPPVARYDSRGRMVYIGGLLADEQRTKCAKFVIKGTVTAAEFDNQKRLVNFDVRARRRGSWRFPLVNPESIAAADLAKLPTLVKEGARLKVTGYGCGASAAVVEPDVIESLNR